MQGLKGIWKVFFLLLRSETFCLTHHLTDWWCHSACSIVAPPPPPTQERKRSSPKLFDVTKVLWHRRCRVWRSLRNLNNTQHYRGRQKSFILPGISSGMSISCEGWGDEAPKLARLQRPYWPGPAPALGTSSEILWNAFWTICAKFFCLKSFNRLFVYICVTKSA